VYWSWGLGAGLLIVEVAGAVLATIRRDKRVVWAGLVGVAICGVSSVQLESVAGLRRVAVITDDGAVLLSPAASSPTLGAVTEGERVRTSWAYHGGYLQVESSSGVGWIPESGARPLVPR